ncbi:hypothetical protein EX30DRAFT_337241 [Ascodesmis nigricans]|uniref:Uncharacterized protein n=1 Tax=Ascodesmis nigricans TaxID=341454 RepID=A0A4S2N678_9PEZI|nr:hypothetical protein EX30DRAFT_337241 [Ascodesmis nigricans]
MALSISASTTALLSCSNTWASIADHVTSSPIKILYRYFTISGGLVAPPSRILRRKYLINRWSSMENSARKPGISLKIMVIFAGICVFVCFGSS